MCTNFVDLVYVPPHKEYVLIIKVWILCIVESACNEAVSRQAWPPFEEFRVFEVHPSLYSICKRGIRFLHSRNYNTEKDRWQKLQTWGPSFCMFGFRSTEIDLLNVSVWVVGYHLLRWHTTTCPRYQGLAVQESTSWISVKQASANLKCWGCFSSFGCCALFALRCHVGLSTEPYKLHKSPHTKL